MCLLGCNGSGKTTIINMLTGLTPLDNDNGDVLIHLDSGRKTVSLRSHPNEFKSYIRLCQQNDFLFEELTVHEHLELICKLRGITERDEIEEEIKTKAGEVSLNSDLYSQVKFISPGTCRKVSIAMSLIGDAKLIIMDEPTSNLDLRSREKIWRLLSRLVHTNDSTGNYRSILLST
jgi:ABC-type multidrug transport system ATPase subunit